ncbi:uncharacterized protein K460DRAFT_274902 [Cucurbitaria berberidis CBS 394.84]|uniref:Zn(2)-C6 fungal-type domain-containing protein n=1 Tax=Cucurbitaria berberidis CBS 394.84 TaxID=1168544 RepID=A0A9P4GPV6_9PLEO|nr:uncharacterized protein K460DRAFT_274902 [Cucurbitaria berberidis CBS 394.84]KAF1850488.1 hypothetical protein K460DRAFT_274902 [Cucurbitaria berberidis CBS 394.84]
MSSESNYEGDNALEESSDSSSQPRTRPSSHRQSRTSNTPRKRPRLGSFDPSRLRKYNLKGRYNDGYRVLFNEEVSHAVARFETASESYQHYTTQIGASIWSSKEQTTLFSALERLGRHDIPGIASAIGTKSIPETQELLLLLQEAASKQGDAKVTLHDIPAAIEVGNKCSEQLDLAGEALAWYQETFEASQEREKFGDYWLITAAIANDITDAVDGRTRAVSSAPASEPEPSRRGGKMVAGSCTACKQSKKRCDRGAPCSNCVRRTIGDCVYEEKPAKSEKQEVHSPDSLDPKDQASLPTRTQYSANHNLLEAIPEANLLQPDVMLTLSKTLFMNRSPTIPSPWPHWSEYTSELAEEPAIYCSAFKDFHTLVVSITKRLAQTALIQATSRLRSQRRRFKNGVLPMVKRRDVLAAIDLLGMKRNGRERWRNVARRCSVRVYEGREDYRTHGKYRREVPWDEVERMMKSTEAATDPLTTDAETSGNDTEAFNYRAARSGTPLPMENLALSDEDDGLDGEFNEPMEGSDDDSLLDERRQPFTRSATQARDLTGRYTSVPPSGGTGELSLGLHTLEQFDQEASRQEEHALWEILELDPSRKGNETKRDEEVSPDDGADVITDPDGWRLWTEYHAEWEEFHRAVPAAKFAAHENSKSPAPAFHSSPSQKIRGSSVDTDTSTREASRRHERQTANIIELRTHGTRAYAALQERGSEPSHQWQDSDEDGSEDDDVVADVPTQSIEDTPQALDSGISEDEMDWAA